MARSPASRKALKPAAEYLNVDLEVRSRSDLTPLVEALSRSLCDLHAERIRGTFLAVFETCDFRSQSSPDIAIRRFAAAIAALRPSTRRLWRKAHDRVFDIGIKSRDGSEVFFAMALRTETLRTITQLNARLAFTFYPPEKRVRRKRRAS